MAVATRNERGFEQVELFGFRLTRIGLERGAKKPSEAQWQQLGDYLAWMEVSLPWLIGGWVAYGEDNFGERAAQAVDATGWDLDTVKQCAWVHRSVPVNRREASLSFSHHRAVAALPAAGQRAMLRAAKDRSMTVAQLQRAVRAQKTAAPDVELTLWLVVSCRSERDRQRLAAKMEAEGRSVKVPG